MASRKGWLHNDMPMPRYFAWQQVQQAADKTDAQVYRHAVATAKELFLNQAVNCPTCGCSADKLVWLCISTPDSTWESDCGYTGWLTLCENCKTQVDFIVDMELTAAEKEDWKLWRQQRT